MKKFIASIVAVLLAVALVAPSAFAVVCPDGNLGKQYTAPKGTVVVDGEIDEIWDAAPWTKIDVPYQADYTPETYDYYGTDCQAKVMWNDDAIYVLVQIVNETDVQEGDVMEIYIEQGEKTEGGFSDIGYQQRYSVDEDGELSLVGGEGYTKLADSNEEICPEMAYKLSNENKTIVMEFKYAILKEGGVKEGDVLGLEFMLEDQVDLDGIRATNDVYRWNICEVDENGPTGVVRPYNESINYGDLILGSTAVIEQPTEEPAKTADAAVTEDAAKTADAAATEAPKDNASADNSWIWWVVGCVVAVAVVAAIVVISKKKK